MSKRQEPAEQLLDLLVYAPLGLLLEARELVPKLADKGRQRMGGQVTVARMIGEMAVRQGTRRAEKVVQRLRDERAGAPAASVNSNQPASANGNQPATTSGGRPAAGSNRPAAATAPVANAGPPPAAATLAIPGYDTLSASQVVPRLEGLSAGELEAIRAYEEATRARKTVLTRIDQLRGSA
jgi:hypothetical protein